MRLTSAIAGAAMACWLLALAAACDGDEPAADPGTTARPMPSVTTDGSDLALALPSAEQLEMPGSTRADDSGAFDASYATHYTLDPGDSPGDLVQAGFQRGAGVTYYLLRNDGRTRDATILLYVAEFASSEQAADFARHEAEFPRDDHPVDDPGSAAFHVGPIQPPGLPDGFAAVHFDVRRIDGTSYSVAFASGARGRIAQVVWLRFEDDAAAQAVLGTVAAALDQGVSSLPGAAPPGEETRRKRAHPAPPSSTIPRDNAQAARRSAPYGPRVRVSSPRPKGTPRPRTMSPRAIMPAMLILDRHRALDFLIVCSARADVPEQYSRAQPELASFEEAPPGHETAPQFADAHEQPAGSIAGTSAREADVPATSALVAGRPAAGPRRSALAGWWRGFTAPAAGPG